jgi:hypothetical protein
LPYRAVSFCGDRAGSVSSEPEVDGVAELAFERAERFFAGLALGDLLLEVGAAVAVGVPDLGERGHVDGVVEAPVAAQREPVDLPLAGGDFDRGSAVVGGEASRSPNRDTPPVAPMMAAAMTGPTPKICVRVVPDAATAAASLVRVLRRWASRRRRSARKSAARDHQF